MKNSNFFPKVEVTSSNAKTAWPNGVSADPDLPNGLLVVDSPRLRRARLHLVAYCVLNREAWKHILMETDDENEWLPHPRQTDHFDLPFNDKLIDDYLGALSHSERVLKGELLIPPDIVTYISNGEKRGLGLNLRKLLDDPPTERMNKRRFWENVVDAKYLEEEKGQKTFDLDVLGVFNSFNGYGFPYPAKLK